MLRSQATSRSLTRAISVVWLLCVTGWFLPIYFDGTRSLVLSLFHAELTPENRNLFSLAGVAIMVPIAFAWKRSRRVGAVVQVSILAALVLWSLANDSSIISDWWKYAGKLALVCGGTATIVSVLLWILSERHPNQT